MQLREMLQDDDAVSPVIGVILMVAITVILAAVIASFVLGLGPGETAPTASFDFEHNSSGNGSVEITHANGDRIDAANLYIRGDVEEGYYDVGTNNGNWTGDNSQAQVGGGNSAVASIDASGEAEIRVVWETADSSQTLDETTIDNSTS